ncbi:MAG: hypothetical protein PF572_04595 [Patescibacteria group bacterium]|jgi:hypothetical protein|nr:hypothetical protein [Patescibacteria group bacterium]
MLKKCYNKINKTQKRRMDPLKIFKYIIAINLAIVLLFVVFLVGVKLYQTKTSGFKIVSTSLDEQEIPFELDLEPNKPDVEGIIKNNTNKDRLENSDKKDDDTLTETEIAINEQKKYEEIYENGNIIDCNGLFDQNLKKMCLNNLAIKKSFEEKDMGYCDYLDNDLYKIDDCRINVVVSYSNKTNFLENCNILEEEMIVKKCKDRFEFDENVLSSGYSICSNITNKEEKDFCYSSVLAMKIINKEDLACSEIKEIEELENDCNSLREFLESSDYANCDIYKTKIFKEICLNL